ncbi:cell growth regulator with RING finger domain protein 1 [Lepeophtheirus salmonis]|uniref:Cell growth regulator with RING finger domain protein 1 n=1 Tax=Lepeophtheirus salmonis TaxID=72036 RepID=C1BV65_LEPSM|nr:cell growth regulator with RING finger domain protein 1-like [Lepeophtheirus salmonis]ACO12918.1 Cell growth regulator with RING finger domain protein 1 [Lepeophtheirus salmonis]
MSSYMVWAAEISTGVSVMTVLVMAALTVLFLTKCLRQDLLYDSGTALTRVDYNPPLNLLNKLSLPLNLSLNSHSDKRMKFKLEFKDSYTLDNAELGFYWRVPIATFHHVLRAPKDWLIRTFSDSSTRSLLFGESIHNFSSSFDKTDDSSIFSISEDCTTWDKEEPLPRNYYPLIVVISLSNNAYIHVVHIQDDVLQIPSRILNFYIKFWDGRSVDMRPLFSQDNGECVVCQENPITRAFLPCRHACSCSDCFKRIKNKCPMCRTFIHSYFLVGDEASQSQK